MISAFSVGVFVLVFSQVQSQSVTLRATAIAAQIIGDPEITSVTPISNRAGTKVTIKGRNFTPDTSILLGGVVIQDFQVIDTQTISNGRIRKVDALTGIIATVAGGGPSLGDNGPATSAALAPEGLAFDSAGNLYIADAFNCRVRKVDARTGIITTVAGTGQRGFSGDNDPATSAALAFPEDLALDSAGNLYIADALNHGVRKVDARTGIITTVAGTGQSAFSGDNGLATSAALAFLAGLTFDSAGNLYIADRDNNRIRAVRGPIDATVPARPRRRP